MTAANQALATRSATIPSNGMMMVRVVVGGTAMLLTHLGLLLGFLLVFVIVGIANQPLVSRS